MKNMLNLSNDFNLPTVRCLLGRGMKDMSLLEYNLAELLLTAPEGQSLSGGFESEDGNFWQSMVAISDYHGVGMDECSYIMRLMVAGEGRYEPLKAKGIEGVPIAKLGNMMDSNNPFNHLNVLHLFNGGLADMTRLENNLAELLLTTEYIVERQTIKFPNNKIFAETLADIIESNDSSIDECDSIMLLMVTGKGRYATWRSNNEEQLTANEG